jgi:WD40-like Beta Propeller Repeat
MSSCFLKRLSKRLARRLRRRLPGQYECARPCESSTLDNSTRCGRRRDVSAAFASALTGAIPGCLLLIVSLSLAAPAPASRQPGAARPLRFAWSDPQTPDAAARAQAYSLSQPAFSAKTTPDGRTKSAALFFTRAANGTRNLWQVAIAPDTRGNSPGGIGEFLAARGQVLRATPLTRFVAPFFAEGAAATPDGRALLFVTNALDGNAQGDMAGRTQIARLDLRNGHMTALTKSDARCHSPVVSPDGSRFAFVSDLSGLESIYVMAMDGGDLRRIATMARHPRWLNADAMVFESTRPGRSGLYRLALPRAGEDHRGDSRFGDDQTSESRPNLLFTRSGSCAVSADEQQLCVATAAEASTIPAMENSATAIASPNNTGDVDPAAISRLYLLAADGSGARAVPGTEEARSPSFAPDNSAIVYDAPADLPSNSGNEGAWSNGSRSNGAPPAAAVARTLWFVPMSRVLPTALLLDVRRARNRDMGAPECIAPTSMSAASALQEVEIIGTAFSDGDSAPQVRLEWGEGSEPARWNPLPVKRAPAHQTALTTWRLPANARGEWTLRLTVTDAAGDHSESTLPFTLPLAPVSSFTSAPSLSAALPPAPSNVLLGGSDAAPESADVARFIAPEVASPPTVRRDGVADVSVRVIAPGVAPIVTPVSTPPSLSVVPISQENRTLLTAMEPVPTSGLPASALAAAPTPTIVLAPTEPAETRPLMLARKPDEGTAPGRSSRPKTPQKRSALRGDAASLYVTGVPTAMRAGESVKIGAQLRNIGTSGWTSTASRPVRVISRWYDAATGRRSSWRIYWLQSRVPPGGGARMSLTLTAPARPGYYKLYLGLVRMNNAAYQPPASLRGVPTRPAGQRASEFVTVVFNVRVE